MKSKLIKGLIFIFILLVLPSQALAATLSFSPAAGSFNRGCNMAINIMLDTQGAQTDGTDVIITYEPTKVSLATNQITNGSIYPEFPGNSVDSASGKISISGISSVSTPYSGSGIFATLNFKVLDNAPAGITTLKFDFNPNDKTKTTDSNVVERGTIADVLSSVTDGSFTLGTGAGCAAGGSGATGQQTTLAGNGGFGSGSATFPTQAPLPKKQLPEAGIFDNTILITTVGVGLTILGIIGLAFL